MQPEDNLYSVLRWRLIPVREPKYDRTRRSRPKFGKSHSSIEFPDGSRDSAV